MDGVDLLYLLREQGFPMRLREKMTGKGLLGRLVQDRTGNTMALIAASIAPMLALVGGGIDMGRGYLSQSRLQQACDAGVLAARKKLGSAVVTDGLVPSDVGDVGMRFFNLNFRQGSYGSENRTFTMELEEDYSIKGQAAVDVPTTIMAIFGSDRIDISVECEAQLNFSNTDVMFVLDTKGSMNDSNPGDSETRIEAMRRVVKDFHAQLEGSKGPGIRIRYGFVPYAVNANVGHLLQDDWVVDEWTYQSRERTIDYDNPYDYTYYDNWETISGSYSQSIVDSYSASWNPGSGGGGGSGNEYGGSSGGSSAGYYSCNGSQPSDTMTTDTTLLSTVTEPYVGPPSGTKTTQHYRRIRNGDDYWTSRSGSTCNVYRRTYSNYTQEYDRITIPRADETWLYKPVTMDVRNWRLETSGCMEERSTYEIYTKSETLDLSRALDLDLTTEPMSGNPDTQWRPMYPDVIWARALNNEYSNDWHVAPKEYGGNYFKPAWYSGLVACPIPARKLAEMSAGDVASYVDSLVPEGQTYHDIGMIWGGRLLAKDGLFADENQDVDGKTTARHLIFLTDGQTEPLDIVYGAYGLEKLDLRRWTERPDPLLPRTIELRFFHACQEVKKLNVTVWIIGFGTAMNDVMKECAGDGHWFQAADSGELEAAFDSIAKSLGDLRISK